MTITSPWNHPASRQGWSAGHNIRKRAMMPLLGLPKDLGTGGAQLKRGRMSDFMGETMVNQ
jgi:hypothetical protein